MQHVLNCVLLLRGLVRIDGDAPRQQRGVRDQVGHPLETAGALLLLARLLRRTAAGKHAHGDGASGHRTMVRCRGGVLQGSMLFLKSVLDGVHLMVAIPTDGDAHHALAGLLLQSFLQLVLDTDVALDLRKAPAGYGKVGHGHMLSVEEVEEPLIPVRKDHSANEGPEICDRQPCALHPDELHLPVASPLDDGAELLRRVGRSDANSEDVGADDKAKDDPEQQQQRSPHYQRNLEAVVRHGPRTRHTGRAQVCRQRERLAVPLQDTGLFTTAEAIIHALLVH
mmetsp:Transcript_59471/g.184596  ORF Transcript_59471/g.184596 Transcript_59471/m.184596 type:complete len:282 (-) Transcript_59471:769-1614(-)